MAAKNQNKSYLMVAIFSLLAGCLLAVYVFLRISGNKSTEVHKQPVQIADAYLTALKNADFESAYALCDTSLRRNIGNSLNLQVEIEGYHIQPLNWQYGATNTSDAQAELHGKMTFKDNGEGTFDLTLTEYKEGWKVSKYTLTRDS
jgi:hypothetical protein